MLGNFEGWIAVLVVLLHLNDVPHKQPRMGNPWMGRQHKHPPFFFPPPFCLGNLGFFFFSGIWLFHNKLQLSALWFYNRYMYVYLVGSTKRALVWSEAIPRAFGLTKPNKVEIWWWLRNSQTWSFRHEIWVITPAHHCVYASYR